MGQVRQEDSRMNSKWSVRPNEKVTLPDCKYSIDLCSSLRNANVFVF